MYALVIFTYNRLVLWCIYKISLYFMQFILLQLFFISLGNKPDTDQSVPSRIIHCRFGYELIQFKLINPLYKQAVKF